jgi:O-antigen ligase
VGSSFLLAVVCIIQRLDGTEKLLWLVTPQIRDPNSPWGYPPKFHFGPYNYRGNAAEYFNLVWPVAVALWWTTRANERRARGISARAGQGPHVLLLPWSVVLGTAPIASASRSGAVVGVGLALVTALILSSSRSIRTLRGRFLTLGSVIVLLAVGTWMLGGDVIHRFQSPQTDPYFSRLEVFDAAQRMAKDFLWLGGGADTFASLSPFYRKDVEAAWVGYAHNDFIEFVITLGVVGTGLLLIMVLLAFLLPWTQHRGGVSKEFTLLVVLALAGMMGHSLVDFPFQVSSLQLEYLFLLAALTTLGRKGSSGASTGISG